MNLTGLSLYPGGAQEVTDADFGWVTEQMVLSETSVAGQDIDDINPKVRCPLAPGESMEFTLELDLAEASTGETAIKVVVPEGCEGGFTVSGFDLNGDYNTVGYGADDFNTYVGDLRGGPPGHALKSYDRHSIAGGVKCGDNPGLLRFQLQSSGFDVMSGTKLHYRKTGV
jgi:hypothetical protein